MFLLEHATMNPDVKARLELYRQDFEKHMGRSFEHFFCPILGVDEDVELQKGHIVNQAFDDSSPVWVVQRRDVDGFFGSLFEADFVKLQGMHSKTMADMFIDPKLNRQFRPGILRNDKPVQYTTRQTGLPDVFTPVILEDDEQSAIIGVKMTPEEILAAAGDKWELAVTKDIRIHSLVSLIKTAHLSLFHLLGYRYAAFTAGRFVGHDILGSFYLNNVKKPRQELLANAESYFREFEHMVRPMGINGMNFQGSISDRLMLVCVGTSGRLWAWIVFVKTAQLVHSVLIPTLTDGEAAATFMDFLRNDNETIMVTTARFDRSNGIWELSPHAKALKWPKSGVLYPPTDPTEPCKSLSQKGNNRGATDVVIV
jgi:hypothetical protein